MYIYIFSALPPSLKDVTLPSLDSTTPLLLSKLVPPDNHDFATDYIVADPLTISLSKEQLREHEEEVQRLDHDKLEYTEGNEVVEILKSVPLYNDKIESKGWLDDQACRLPYDSHNPCIPLEELRNFGIKGICSLQDNNGKPTNTIKYHLHKDQSCIIKHKDNPLAQKWCPNVQDLYRLTSHLDQYLSEISTLKHLKPKMTVIGSIAEGTRNGQADEMDININFEGLEGENAFAKLTSPYQLSFTSNGLAVMEEANLSDLVKSDKTLDYSKFLLILVQELRDALLRIEKGGNFPDFEFNLSYSVNETSCQACQKLRAMSIEELKSEDCSPDEKYKHCEKCLPAVTLTKRGPCMIMKNKKYKVHVVNTN